VPETGSHRLKLLRARQHLHTLNAQVASFGERNPYSFSDKFEPESGKHVSRVKILREPLPMWSVSIGDSLQGMRAALDHLAYALTLKHSGEPDRPEDVAFPIFRDPKLFQGSAKEKRIGGIHPEAQAFIERLQPYHRTDSPDEHVLMALHDLARWDRHRALHVTLAAVYGTTLEIHDTTDLLITETEIHTGRLEDGAPIASFRYVVTGPNPEVNFEVSPVFGIVFDEGAPGYSRYVVETLDVIRTFIGETVFPPLETFL
jgi:hypothetical protein